MNNREKNVFKSKTNVMQIRTKTEKVEHKISKIFKICTV